MSLQYADRISNIKASEIRELLKLSEQPEIISFAGGFPAPELFPKDKLAEVTSKVLTEQGEIALQYTTTEGYAPLRKIIVEERMAPAGVKCDISNIMLTNGSQQGLEFSAKLFINEGDIIICESPSYLGAINAFKAYNPKFVEIPMDKDGMVIEDLEKALKGHSNVKMIYTIPDFQNPSGITMSLERRKRIAELAAEYEIPVIEDSPYGELRFDGERLPSIKAFDEAGYVVTLGTFSKTFCPGLRLGWIVASPEILKKYVLIKQGADLQCNTLCQISSAKFMEQYKLDDHIAKIIEVYRVRRDLMIDSMKKYFPKDVKFTFPEGGLFTWVELREDLDSSKIMEDALKEKVAYVPGASFFPNGGKKNFFRLNYSNMTNEKIIEGIKRLGNVLYKHYGNQ
ncbi:aminotransferase class I and II family protein [Clostridium argentinense CDC 2741]|uniref:Aminotransferase class I and II family protein n=1 Tax=Clostridium argentinense CDC 2741 TaxID=1418104 RepID=A0A0C1U8R6_9CLOT|nr:PLP-dependent aminotransferase family protein [Clostridium argentinense]ARC85182.1 aminotransferase [Clostridium argentinense]KIE48108.1 aminotransferase class I and II family protein [Clostridium argentinense CDC 2741]NFF39515.1 PLP-dependent aminotransferase family protein [Clostridium argentinense]NFP50938.1 PLP-dependent aminotransferase family protein [Clostridium argentinense]NFP73668.1 PLP-dependent aminotransferase family protein [Clostridium argentinense]